jgi:hypothetical protein
MPLCDRRANEDQRWRAAPPAWRRRKWKARCLNTAVSTYRARFSALHDFLVALGETTVANLVVPAQANASLIGESPDGRRPVARPLFARIAHSNCSAQYDPPHSRCSTGRDANLVPFWGLWKSKSSPRCNKNDGAGSGGRRRWR